jgi:hypothetical protein
MTVLTRQCRVFTEAQIVELTSRIKLFGFSNKFHGVLGSKGRSSARSGSRRLLALVLIL